MRKSQYKVGTKVIRNNIQIGDSDEIKFDSIGTIIRISGERTVLVEWKHGMRERINWWIDERCVDLYEPISKEEAVIKKIKYLNERYDNRHANIRL